MELAHYFITKAAPDVEVTFNSVQVCTPLIDFCEGFKPSDGRIRLYARISVFNSGATDVRSQIVVTYSSNNEHITFVDQDQGQLHQ